jgi:hypothetical protein
MIQAMLHAKTPQHLIHIYEKTGFIVDSESYRRLSRSEKKEIREANAEYDALHGERAQDLYQLSDYNDFGKEDGPNPTVNALYILGNFVERNVDAGDFKIDEQRFICAYLVVRAFRILRAIFRSKRYTTSEESLILIRSLYEIYCKLCYATKSKSNAKYLLDSDFGLVFGDYEFSRENGKTKRNKLTHKKTGKKIPRTRSFYEYISSSPFPEDLDLFEILYEYLSSFVHSGSRHALKAWGEGRRSGFSLTNENDENVKVFSSVLESLISAMIMQILLRLRSVSRVSRWDINLFGFVTRKILEEVGTLDHSEIVDLMPKMKARAAVLPQKIRRFVDR